MATTADIVINFAAVSIALNYPLNSIEFFNKLSSIFYYSVVTDRTFGSGSVVRPN